MKKQSLILFLFSILFSTFQLSAQKISWKGKREIKKNQKIISYLASDDLKGRDYASEEDSLTSVYISKHFSQNKLIPKGEKGYFCPIKSVSLRIATNKTALSLQSADKQNFKDFYVLSSSVNQGRFTGFLVDLGFGIEEDLKNHNDYKNLDISGKAVAINIASPDGINPHSKFLNWHSIERRAAYAEKKGAKAVVFYSLNKEKPNGVLRLTSNTLNIPVIFSNDTIDWGKKNVEIDLNVDVFNVIETGYNVVGMLDFKAPKTIVIAAHHDHLGLGEEHSLDGNKGYIHNGADDNASGVAVLISLAKRIRKQKKKFSQYNYLFITFTGEEKGLYGSKRFIENPTIAIENIAFMVNMDMVGRLKRKEKTLVINGVGTSPAIKNAIENIKLDTNAIKKIKTTESGIGASDHTSFYLKDIPAVHFFTGQHQDYHKSTDDEKYINYQGMYFVTNYIEQFIEEMASNKEIKFTKTASNDSSGRMSFNVTLGIMPDYIYDGNGLRIDGVRSDGVAAKAQLLKGDIIVKMGDMDIKNINEYMKSLSTFKKGDQTKIVIQRKNQVLVRDISF